MRFVFVAEEYGVGCAVCIKGSVWVHGSDVRLLGLGDERDFDVEG